MSTWNDESLGESLRRLPEARASEDFTRTVLTRVAQADAADESGGGRWISAPQLAALGAALVALVVAAVLLVSPGGDGRDGVRTADAGAATAEAPPTVGVASTTPRGEEPANEGIVSAAPGPPVGDDDAGDETPERDAPPTAPEGQAVAGGTRLASAEPVPEAPGGGVARSDGTAATPNPSRVALASPSGGDRLTATEARDALDRLNELRREQRQLRQRLAALTDGSAAAPTLLLGGDESLELVLNLGEETAAPWRGGYGARPATYRPANDTPRYF